MPPSRTKKKKTHHRYICFEDGVMEKFDHFLNTLKEFPPHHNVRCSGSKLNHKAQHAALKHHTSDAVEIRQLSTWSAMAKLHFHHDTEHGRTTRVYKCVNFKNVDTIMKNPRWTRTRQTFTPQAAHCAGPPLRTAARFLAFFVFVFCHSHTWIQANTFKSALQESPQKKLHFFTPKVADKTWFTSCCPSSCEPKRLSW